MKKKSRFLENLVKTAEKTNLQPAFARGKAREAMVSAREARLVNIRRRAQAS